mgnify:FL=1
MVTEYQKAVAFILTQATDGDIRGIVEAAKSRREGLTRQNIRLTVVGDKVSFSGRNGLTLTGTVTKVMQKNVIVNTPRGNYRVPANMLTAG